MRSGQAQGDSTAKLVDAVSDLRDELRPPEDQLIIITSNIAAYLAKEVTLMGKVLKAVQNPLRVILWKNEIPKEKDELKLPIEVVLDRIAERPPAGLPGFKAGGARPPLPPVK